MELKDIICNRCGKSCVSPHHSDQTGKVTCYESATLMANWGYGTDKDGETHRANLCESCYDYVISACGIKPNIYDYVISPHGTKPSIKDR